MNLLIPYKQSCQINLSHRNTNLNIINYWWTFWTIIINDKMNNNLSCQMNRSNFVCYCFSQPLKSANIQQSWLLFFLHCNNENLQSFITFQVSWEPINSMFSKSAVVNHDHKRSNALIKILNLSKIVDIESKLLYNGQNILCDKPYNYKLLLLIIINVNKELYT